MSNSISNIGGSFSLPNQSLSLSGNILTLSNGGSVDLSPYLDDTDISDVALSLSGSILTIVITEDGNNTTDTVDLSTLLDDTNAWYTNGTTTTKDDTRTNAIHHNGDIHIGDGTAASTVIISSANSVATVPDISFNVQGLIQSNSNQFYHSQTGNHQFIGGNTSGTTGSTPLVDFNQNGEVEFNQYGSGTFTGTPVFNLQVTSDGSVIESPIVAASALNTTKADIGTNWVSAEVGLNGGVTNQNGTIDALNATVSNGTGNNFGPGNRYTLTFPAHPNAARYQVFLTPIGVGSPNGGIPHIIQQTAGSVTYIFRTGDDGGGVDENTRFPHHVLITGPRTSVVTDVTLT